MNKTVNNNIFKKQKWMQIKKSTFFFFKMGQFFIDIFGKLYIIKINILTQ